MNRISVFCGSSRETATIYEMAANFLGQKLAQSNIGLVYGGASVGLMGAVADGALMKNGQVIGVIPKFFHEKGIAHEGLTELILVDTMHQRKTKMDELCEGVIALPGGFGTMEELFEMLTWAQIGLHEKPIGILNINGYYDPLLTMLDSMVMKGFLKDVNRQMVLVNDNTEELLLAMKNYKAPEIKKWASKKEA